MSEIQVDDEVRIRFIEPSQIVRNSNDVYVVKSIKSMQPNASPFWELLHVNDNELLVIDTPVVFLKAL